MYERIPEYLWTLRNLSQCQLICTNPSLLVRSLLGTFASGGSDGKESACNVGDLGSIPGLGRSPGKGNGKPTPVFLPGESHGRRSLEGYSLRGCEELDTTGRLSTASLYTHGFLPLPSHMCLQISQPLSHFPSPYIP